MKKNEIIEALLAKGIKQEEIANLKLKELKTMLEEEQKGENSLIILDQIKDAEDDPIRFPVNSPKEIKLEQDKKVVPDMSLSNPPVPSDAGWTQYVLSLLQDDEMEGEHPRLEGLRRVAELLLGEVIEERCELIFPPSVENEMTVGVKSIIIFENGKRFEALADANCNNCQKEFSMYLTAMADTRSKGRAYRAALHLKRVVSAEEIGVSNNEEVENPNKLINTGQITTIRLLSDRSGISIHKLLTDLEISCVVKDGAVDLKTLKYSEALVVLNRLNSMRQEEFVPEKLKR